MLDSTSVTNSNCSCTYVCPDCETILCPECGGAKKCSKCGKVCTCCNGTGEVHVCRPIRREWIPYYPWTYPPYIIYPNSTVNNPTWTTATCNVPVTYS